MTTIYINDEPESTSELKENTIASIGFFDGVHKGHRFLIDQLKNNAAELKLPSAIITFPIHPRKVLQSDYQPRLLNSFEEKLELLSTTGVDYCFVLDFTKELSQLSAKEFIQQKLHNELRVKALLIGYDHKFGKGRTDGFEQYKRYGENCGMDIIAAESLQEVKMHISSTTVRHLLAEGNVEDAARILTYNYILDGIVVDGNKMGREMGFPTANLELPEKEKIIPKSGIYATWAYVEDKKYMSMSYIGTRPSIFATGENRIEVNLLNFNGDLYGKRLKLEFINRIRNDIKFDYIDDLKKQLHHDKNTTIKILSANTL